VSSYTAKLQDESIDEALLRAFYEANAAVLAVIRESGSMAGSTLAAAVVHQGALHWVASGDSRIYHCRGTSAWQITRDHVYWRELEEQVAAGKIDAVEAACDVQRHSLTSHLGRVNPVVERPQKPLPLQPGDLVLLCSDGLHGVLTDAEIGAEAGRGEPQYVCQALVRRTLARARPDQDNVTVVALGLPAPRRRLFWGGLSLATGSLTRVG
jgi:protein phosphatase